MTDDSYIYTTEDHDPDRVFAAVGYAITQWELLELEHAMLYATFCSSPSTLEKLNEYGDKGPTFQQRMKVLENAADDFFRVNCSQQLESELKSLVCEAGSLSKKRHQIAHGVVSDAIDGGMRDESGWTTGVRCHFIVPPWYTVTRLAKTEGYYRLSSANMDTLARQFIQARQRVVDFREKISAVR